MLKLLLDDMCKLELQEQQFLYYLWYMFYEAQNTITLEQIKKETNFSYKKIEEIIQKLSKVSFIQKTQDGIQCFTFIDNLYLNKTELKYKLTSMIEYIFIQNIHIFYHKDILESIFKIKSKYGIRMLFLLLTGQIFNEQIVPHEVLKKMFCIEDKYKSFGDFCRYVLDAAIKYINYNTKYKISYIKLTEHKVKFFIQNTKLEPRDLINRVYVIQDQAGAYHYFHITFYDVFNGQVTLEVSDMLFDGVSIEHHIHDIKTYYDHTISYQDALKRIKKDEEYNTKLLKDALKNNKISKLQILHCINHLKNQLPVLEKEYHKHQKDLYALDILKERQFIQKAIDQLLGYLSASKLPDIDVIKYLWFVTYISN